MVHSAARRNESATAWLKGNTCLIGRDQTWVFVFLSAPWLRAS